MALRFGSFLSVAGQTVTHHQPREGLALGGRALEALGGALEVFLVIDLQADGRMGADHGALAALDAEVRFPLRRFEGDVALLPLSGGRREGAVAGHLADGQFVAAPGDDLGGDGVDELRRLVGHRRQHLDGTARLLRHGHLVQVRQRLVHCGVVHLHHLLAPASVGLLDGFLDVGDRLVLGQHAAHVCMMVLMRGPRPIEFASR